MFQNARVQPSRSIPSAIFIVIVVDSPSIVRPATHLRVQPERNETKSTKPPEPSKAVQFPVPFSLSLWSTPRRLYGPQPTCGSNRKELTQIDGNPVNSRPRHGGRGAAATGRS